MVVVTPRSLANERATRVTVEFEWALARGRPIIAVVLDGRSWDT